VNEANSWKMHLSVGMSEEEPTIKVGGCRVPLPAKPSSSFWRAVEQGDTARVEEMLGTDGDIDQLGGAYGSTVLGWAALAADEPLLKVRSASRCSRPALHARTVPPAPGLAHPEADGKPAHTFRGCSFAHPRD
jgi:hypothetical protein